MTTTRVNPPTSPYPTSFDHAKPISQGHCQQWHHKMKVSYCL